MNENVSFNRLKQYQLVGDIMETVVRLDGAVEVTLEKLVELGYFKTKSEAIRAGLLELGKEYNVGRDSRELEKTLVVRKTQGIDEEIDSGKRKLYSLKEVLKESKSKK